MQIILHHQEAETKNLLPLCQSLPVPFICLVLWSRAVFLLLAVSRLLQLQLPCQFAFTQWPFQEPKLEVPTIYKAYIRPM